MNDQIAKEVTDEIVRFCGTECSSVMCCLEDECVLYRIEQIVLKERDYYAINEENMFFQEDDTTESNFNSALKEQHSCAEEDLQMKKKLKPCPFCMSEVLYLLNSENRFGIGEHYIFCNSCKTSFGNEFVEDNEDETIDWWNNIKR